MACLMQPSKSWLHQARHEVLAASSTPFFWTVRCIDINTLLERIYNPQGNIDVSLLHFKLGLDFGRGFLKLIISGRLVKFSK